MDTNKATPKKMKKSKKKIAFAIIAVIVAAVILFFVFAPKGGSPAKLGAAGTQSAGYSEGKIEKRTIQTTLSSSGTLKPADEYTVTAQVSGEILECSFEEGDRVSEDQMLYVIDSSDMENTIDRAQISYDRTKRSYDKIVESLEDLNIYSDYNGILTSVLVEVGDTVQNGATIATLVDSSVMKMTLPFASADAKRLSIGQKGQAVIDGSYEMHECVITDIDTFDSVYNDRAVRYVDISVDNPDGGIFTITTASVNFGNILSLGSGTFENNKEATIRSNVSGEVVSVLKKGAYVTADETLVCLLESETLEENFTDAQASLDDAQLSFDNTKEKLDDYTITAPITGTVIEKYSKLGDNLDTTKGQTTMALIYDMSYLEFEMALDELDVSKVEAGQKVIISCDAVSLSGIEGEITKVSIVGTTSYNSTTYPVTIRIPSPPEELLPGMNVDAELVVAEAVDVLTVPTAAIQRGNVIYVKYDGVKDENDNAPEGFKSVRIETGISNENYIEIKDNGELKEGDVIYIPQAIRATSDQTTMFGGIGGMPNMGNMPNMGGMPSGNMGGQRPSGNMGGQRPSGNMGGGMR